MPSTFYELECGGEPAVMEVVAPGEIIFHDFDPEAERAAIELGFQPSACFVVWHSSGIGQLDKALRWAAFHGYAATVEALLAAGADVHVNHDLPLRHAARLGHAVIVEILLASGADVRAADDYALRAASAYGHPDVVQILVDWVEEHG